MQRICRINILIRHYYQLYGYKKYSCFQKDVMSETFSEHG